MGSRVQDLMVQLFGVLQFWFECVMWGQSPHSMRNLE